MKVAVTAASGQLGTAIIYELRKRLGLKDIIGIARNPEKAEHNFIEIRKGDYNSKEDFLEALKDIDRLLIISSNDAPQKRIVQHRNIIEAAKECGVQKIVYTSIMGESHGNEFSPVVSSNRQTESDIIESGIDYSIGRNSLYIEPDLDYLENYIKEGKISNSAGEGKCNYTSRAELAYAYGRLLLSDSSNGKIFSLGGEAITQSQLADMLNMIHNTNLVYEEMSPEDYLNERKEALGEHLGTIIGGIYNGIRDGAFHFDSDFEEAAGRPHLSALEMVMEYSRLKS